MFSLSQPTKYGQTLVLIKFARSCAQRCGGGLLLSKFELTHTEELFVRLNGVAYDFLHSLRIRSR